MGNLQSSPSSSTTTLQEKYDVFLSFRGEDTRDGFTNNLYEALLGKKIKTFIDNQLTRGDRISRALSGAIEESKISVVIFSKDYASSKWCLRELVEIMECKTMNKQTVIPVFYGVDPSDIRNQTGSFKDSFVKHEFFFPNEVQKWREALNEASHLSGWNSFITRPDTKLVTAIVNDIYKKLTGDENISSPSDFKGLIGLDERIDKVKSLLCLHKTDVRIIGIWGMGGIGKTTLAEAIFNQISGPQFEGVCMIENVKENIEKKGSGCLLKDILSKVLNDKNLESVDPIIIPPIIKKRLNQTRVFIVLDDVDDFSPLQKLARRVDGLGQGSRIIITSRDKRVLLNCGVDDQNIYEVKEFNHKEALRLFCNCAFNQDQPTEDLRKLSNDIVNYAGGNPLALTVFGSSLRGSSLNQESKKKVWETTVGKLRTNFNNSISKKLEISYDGLEEEAKEVFLDIACFLKGRDRDYVASILDDCDLWLKDLIHKSLITVSPSHNTIQMHDLLQDLGREIVRKQSPTDPGKRSRLWAPEDVQRTLKNNAGTNVVEGIFLDMFKMKDMHLSLEAFNKMYNIRLLKFYNSKEWITQSINKVQFGEGLNNAPFDKLRTFIWCGYPLTALSSNFNLENLVELNLSCSSNLERLWEDTEHAPKLKWLHLNGCPRLIEVPDLSRSPCLEKIDLNGCSRLTKIQNLSNLASLKKIYLNGCSSLIEISDLSGSPLLETIGVQNCRSLLDFPLLASHLNYLPGSNLRGCESLRSIPSTIVIFSGIFGESLDLSSCINLTTFPQMSERLYQLDLSGTAIDEVPPSIENLIKLSLLNLSECTRLKHISTNICKLKSLKELNLENCSQLESFPEILDKMESLKILNLSGTAIKKLPHSFEHLTNLSELYLRRCKKLESLLCNLISLKCLNISDCPKLEILGNLKSLEDLSMDRIAISQLPSTTMHLNETVKISCRGCRELRFTDLPGSSCSLTRLYLNDCNLMEIPEDIGRLSSLDFVELSGNNFESLPKSMKQLYKLTSLKVDNCNKLQSLTDLPSALEYLSVSGCNKLQSLTELSSALKNLSASGCKQLRSIPDASEFANLFDAEFIFTNCLNLKETAVGNMLATLKKGYEEGDEIGELTFCCPGSKVPKWFMYRTEGSSIVDWAAVSALRLGCFVRFFWGVLCLGCLLFLSLGLVGWRLACSLPLVCCSWRVVLWCCYKAYFSKKKNFVDCCELKFQMPWHDGSNGRPLLGFVVCAVIAFEKYCCIKGDSKHVRVVYKYTCSDGDESSPNNITGPSRTGGSYIGVGFGNETLIDSDHIAFGFCKTFVPRKRESDFTNCSFECWFPDEENPNCRIKSFGVCPIYGKHNITIPNFKKQKTKNNQDP